MSVAIILLPSIYIYIYIVTLQSAATEQRPAAVTRRGFTIARAGNRAEFHSLQGKVVPALVIAFLIPHLILCTNFAGTLPSPRRPAAGSKERKAIAGGNGREQERRYLEGGT